MQEKIDAYFEGYRRIPDGDDPDFIAMEKVGLEDSPHAGEDWPEAPADDGSAVVTTSSLHTRPAGRSRTTRSLSARWAMPA